MRFAPLLLLLLLAAPASGAEPLGLMAVPQRYGSLLAATDLMVEGGTRSHLHVHGTDSDRALLDGLGVPYTVLTTDLRLLRPATGISRDAQYHSPATISDSLRELAAAYPSVARVVDVGTSWEGRELTGVVLTDNPLERELDEPALRILGTHHGDEWSSMEVAWSTAWALAEGYGSDPAITELIDGAEVWIVPVVNPDGVEAFTRRNSRGVDLNRNYGFEWISQSSAGSAPFSEVETEAVRLLSWQRSFGHSLTMHSGAINLGWVWNWTLAPTDDDAVLEALCERYLLNNPQPDFWITNGAAWYTTRGDTNDWSYGVRGGHDYTLEISLDKAPPEAELQDFLDWHTPASVDFLLDGLATGVRGTVTSDAGRGVEATVTSDLDPWPIYTDPETGAFSRPVSAGTHTFTVHAEGYAPTSVVADVAGIAAGPSVITATLTPLAAFAVEGAEGFATPANSPADATLCGTDVLAHVAAGGGLALHRPGLGSWPLDTAIDSGATPCVLATLDPEEIPNGWDRIGEWTLLWLDASGAAVSATPLAMGFTTPGPTIVPADVELSTAPVGGTFIDLVGEGLPEGATIRFVGSDGVRRAPLERVRDEGGDTNGVGLLRVRVDVADWPEGAISMRLVGGGEFISLEGALLLTDGVLTSTFVPPGDDDDDDDDDDDSAPADDDDSAPADDDDATPADDDDDSAPLPPPSGCASCGSGGSGTLALLPLLMLPLSLRRRRTSR
ncbi:MAG: hypothetical protein KDA24_14020 [Deltaproteobacteria bacterium]|nr:hypothetical protein [Deltaproteobacteria bacterium]